jgi:hypothetical protein
MIQTQTIDIGHVKKIFENCPNFEKIIHYEYPFGDILSKKLIDWYRELIFSANGNNENQLLLIRALDRSLYLYVRDNKYKRGLRKIITTDDLTFENKDLIKEVIKRLIEFTNNYEKKEVREVSVSKWL